MIYVLKTGLDILHVLGNVYKINRKSVTLVLLDFGNVLGLKSGMKNDDPILIRLTRVFNQGSNRYVKIRYIMIVGGEKNGDFLRLRIGTVIQNGSSFDAMFCD